jgi:hypothetical protein
VPQSPDVHPNAPTGGAGPGFSKGVKPLGLNPTLDVADFTRGPVGRDPLAPVVATSNQAASSTGAASAPAAAATGGAPAAAAAADAKPATDPDIEALNLSDTAKKAAYELKKAKPSVVFTSGRRDKDEQASAMAENVVQDRDWIKNTYAKSTARDACQKWVDDNKEKKTKDEIATGLKGVLGGLTDAQLRSLSKHLSGDAFDVQPVDADSDDIKKAIRGLTGITKFLEKEGNLVRWHAEF